MDHAAYQTDQYQKTPHSNELSFDDIKMGIRSFQMGSVIFTLGIESHFSNNLRYCTLDYCYLIDYVEKLYFLHKFRFQFHCADAVDFAIDVMTITRIR